MTVIVYEKNGWVGDYGQWTIFYKLKLKEFEAKYDYCPSSVYYYPNTTFLISWSMVVRIPLAIYLSPQ